MLRTHHRHRSRLLLLSTLGALTGCADVQPFTAAHIASGSTSHALCSGLFLSGRDPDATYREEMRPDGGMVLVDWALRYDVDRARREVTTTIAGGFHSRAIYREGYGCLLLRGEAPPALAATADVTPARPASFDGTAGPTPVTASNARVRAAIDDDFAEPDAEARRNTKAVVVVHRGRVIGERYADDVGIDTPLHGHSVSKSVTNALIGILAREGKLDPLQPAPIPEWHVDPDDPRAHVTPDALLRMASGLPADEYWGGFDAATRMWHIERDMAAFAAAGRLEAPPRSHSNDARWNYSNRGYMLLARIVRERAGGNAESVRAFAQRELFAPLGMHKATIEFDAVGTPILASHVYATARDWARFGLLYLNDGVIDGRHILPAGWVRASTTPTPDTGYGAGFWLNTTDAPHRHAGHWGMPGAPRDAFFARGYLGQFVVVVPSAQLVVVRLGVTHRRGGDVASAGRLVSAIVAALEQKRADADHSEGAVQTESYQCPSGSPLRDALSSTCIPSTRPRSLPAASRRRAPRPCI
jgi:hypothetical protein